MLTPRRKPWCACWSSGIPLIEDIYGDAYFGSAPVRGRGLDRGGNVLLCSSFTKSLAPGFRVG